MKISLLMFIYIIDKGTLILWNINTHISWTLNSKQLV